MKKKRFSLGPLFGEGIQKSLKKHTLTDKRKLGLADEWSNKGFLEGSGDATLRRMSGERKIFVYVLFFIAFVTLFARSFELQIIEGGNFIGKANENRFRVNVSHAPRGVIYDRNGEVLARNIPSFKVTLDQLSLREEEKDSVVNKLVAILDIPKSNIIESLANNESPLVTIKDNVSHEEVLRLETQEIPGVGVEIRPMREYPFGEVAAHLIGYTSEVSVEEIDNPHSTPHQLGDRVGRAGVEKSFENILRGANGYELVKVDANGKKQGSLVTTKPVAGGDITLSIDIYLQKRVYKVLNKWLKNANSKAGSVIVMDPRTGEVLSLVSIPSFDNNIFESGLTQKKYDELVNHKQKPLLNRVVSASYPPGSTFKLITAAAGLESGAIEPHTKIVDTGFIKLGDRVFNNWLWLDHREAEGAIDVVRAIARSNDTFFYKLGQKIGEVMIQKTAQNFSIGSITGINLPSETSGLLPTEEWKIQTKGESWYLGETLNLAIGQGDLLVSPLQLSLVSSVYANGGSLIKPTILKGNEPEIIREGFLSNRSIDTVRQGMYKNTVDDGNVSYLFSDYKVKSGGKTGTAESGSKRPHAWYTAFAPYNNPEVVVTVMAEHAGHGSEVAAPAVKEIFEWWFESK